MPQYQLHRLPKNKSKYMLEFTQIFYFILFCEKTKNIDCSLKMYEDFNLSIIKVAESSDDLLFVQLICL